MSGMQLLRDGATIRRIATGSTWSEGPVWLPQRAVLRWSDIPGNRILEVDPVTEEVSVYLDDAEFTNGRTLGLAGEVIQCSHGRRAVEQDVDGVVTTLVAEWDGHRFNSPNDVVVASDGAIWFTDPPYGIIQPHEGHPGEREYGAHFVFRFDPVSGVVTPVITDIEEPNGLAFSPDEGILYVSDTSRALRTDGTGNHHIVAYDVAADHTCGNRRVFAVIDRGVSDGFRVDEDGRIWTSSGDGVIVYSAEGEQLLHIPVPEIVANVCFGGVDGTTLFITATTSVYSVETTVRQASRPTNPTR
jgi:gluconolactonase